MIVAKTMGANVLLRITSPAPGAERLRSKPGPAPVLMGPIPALGWTSGSAIYTITVGVTRWAYNREHTRKPVAQFDTQTGKLTLNGRQCKEEIIRLPRPRPKDALQ